MLFSKIATLFEAEVTIAQDCEIKLFCTDSRQVSNPKHTLFLALQGSRNGNDFIEDAYEKGVRNFICNQKLDYLDANILVVQNSMRAFQQIAAAHRAGFDIPIVGITGSNGKTIVKEWLGVLLAQQLVVAKSPKSYNSQLGVPKSILGLEAYHDVGIFEAGVSQPGEMSHLAEIIAPTLGIFTNLGTAHDAGFSSREQKLQEKLLLYRSCEKVLVRTDNPYFKPLENTLKDKLIGWSNKDANAKYSVNWDQEEIIINGTSFTSNLSNKTDLENVTHAIIAAIELDITTENIQKGLHLLRPVTMRMEMKKGINDCYILDDSYNNDLAGIRAALEYMEIQNSAKRTIILSDILHNSEEDNTLYQAIATLIQEKNVDRFIGVGPRISAQQRFFLDEHLFFDSTQDLLENLPDFQDELIIVKGARDFSFEKIVKRLETKSHQTVLEINHDALLHNLNAYRSLTAPNVKMMAMVKANAYGGGLLEIARFLEHHGIDQLGVAYLDEAIALRQNEIKLPIMIMNPHVESYQQFERFKLEAEIFNITHLQRLLKDTKNPPAIHLKIDTGMHRLGFSQEEIPTLLDMLTENKQLKIEGIFTHFSSADMHTEDAFTMHQAEVFEATVKKIVNVLGYRPTIHASNSSAIVRWPQYHFDMVRLGIGLHGFDPTGQLQLRPSAVLRTIVSQIQLLKKGDAVGYSRRGKLHRDSKIAILPIGYEDGFSRVLGNGKGSVLINDQLAPTVGNICMDMTMVDVTEITVQEGDDAIIFGVRPGIEDLAKQCDTIPYEILTSISNRVKRIFVSE